MSEPATDLDLNSDYVDATSECEKGHLKNFEEEYHDAAEIRDTYRVRAVNYCGNSISEFEKSQTLESRNIPSVVSSVDVGSLPDSSQKTKDERKIREPSINVQQFLHNLYGVEKPLTVLPGMGLEISNNHPLMTNEISKDPKNNINSKKEEDSMNPKKDKWTNKIIPVSRQRSPEKASLGFQFKVPSLKRPITLTAACLDEIAKGHFESSKTSKQSESVNQRRSYTGSASILQKKLRRVTFVNQKDDFKNDDTTSCEKLNSPISKKFGSKETRIEEVEKRIQRIGAAILNSCVEKSFTTLKHKGKKTQFLLNLNHSPSVRSHSLRRMPSTPRSVPKGSGNNNDKCTLEAVNLDPPDANNFNHIEISLVEVRKDVSPMSSTDVMNANYNKFLSNKSITEAAVNTEQITDIEDALALRKEKEEYFLSNICLKKDNENLKEIISKQQKKECDLKKEIAAISEVLTKTNLSLKEVEKKFIEKDSTIAQLRCCVNKVHDLSGNLKEKDDLIADLENKNSRIIDENSRMKKELDRRTVELHNLNKEREGLMDLICQLRKERDSMELKISDFSGKIKEREQEHINLMKILSTEREQFASLEDKRDMNLSSNIVNLSEQLLEKDSIISALEKLRDGILLINKEVCCMLSSTFKEFGLHKSESEIESLISSGRSSVIKNSLVTLIKNNHCIGLEASHDECKNLIFNLEDRAAVLEAELEESKKYTETLTKAISGGKIWDVKCEGQKKGEVEKIRCRREREENALEASIGDTRNLSGFLPKNLPRNLFDLFVLLEGKQQALKKMEKRVKELEEVHAICKQKRVRNEMRIDQLEMALAAVKI